MNKRLILFLMAALMPLAHAAATGPGPEPAPRPDHAAVAGPGLKPAAAPASSPTATVMAGTPPPGWAAV